ncbi:hypothetical protein BDZ89DRAFT_243436 [Hymenopellis radicata]|nr:hypothetical protein BDZ89DRAFT_243436 [Hymenopellis radicata]
MQVVVAKIFSLECRAALSAIDQHSHTDALSPCHHHGTHEQDALPLRQRGHRSILNHDGRRRLPAAITLAKPRGPTLTLKPDMTRRPPRGHALVPRSYLQAGRIHGIISSGLPLPSKDLSILTASSSVRSRCTSSYHPTTFGTSRMSPSSPLYSLRILMRHRT